MWEARGEEVGSRETLLVNITLAGAKGSCHANATLGTPVKMQSNMWHSVGTSYSGCLVWVTYIVVHTTQDASSVTLPTHVLQWSQQGWIQKSLKLGGGGVGASKSQKNGEEGEEITITTIALTWRNTDTLHAFTIEGGPPYSKLSWQCTIDLQASSWAVRLLVASSIYMCFTLAEGPPCEACNNTYTMFPDVGQTILSQLLVAK